MKDIRTAFWPPKDGTPIKKISRGKRYILITQIVATFIIGTYFLVLGVIGLLAKKWISLIGIIIFILILIYNFNLIRGKKWSDIWAG